MHTTTVYLICFQPGIPRGARPGNASHYLGSTSYPDPADRLHEHLTGAGSPLVKAAHDRGLNPEVVATWPGFKQTERGMKRRHRLAHYCPRCGSQAARARRSGACMVAVPAQARGFRAARGAHCRHASLSCSLVSALNDGSKNSPLGAAKAAKFDEFYTQWADIEREMNAYLEYDPDVFRDKVILLPCDDPEWSNFTKFFALHFMDFGLKKLISTSYAPDSNPATINYQPTLFESESPAFDAIKTHANGKRFTLEAKDVNPDGVIDIDDLQWEYLDGDGDFRSPEVTALRDEADFVITNPPFSLFRPFMTWVVGDGRQFSVIANTNAITYNEVFPHIMANELWKGATANSTDMVFGVPKGTPVTAADRLKAEKLGYPSDDERDYTRQGNSCWFTNIDHGRRHEPLQLMTTADNIRFSKHKEVRGVGYSSYDNFDAIEVPFVDAIPSDHDGLMGVPITFLDKYNPDQFEIVGSSQGDYPPTKTYGKKQRVVNGVHMKSNTGSQGCFVRTESFGPGTYFDVGYPVRRIFQRLFIRPRGDS